MPAINCDQFTKILDDKLIPLNSTISELKKSVNEAMSFLEVVNLKYDELLEMMKSSKDERKALKDENKILQDENKILKATIRSIKSSLESVTRANNNLEQYTRRECVEIRGIPDRKESNAIQRLFEGKEGYGVQVHLDFKWKNLHEKRQRLCCSPY